MIRVLVTGRQGQVARALAERAQTSDDMALTFVGRPEFDLCDEASIRSTIADLAPDIVISAAAYTAVDKAEDDATSAFQANARAPGIIAEATRAIGGKLVHLSTDYVFDGRSTASYAEDAPTSPINVYGQSKLAGEAAIRAAGVDHFIVRTSWIHSPFGTNFARTMLRLAAERDVLRVVGDQFGNPTSAFSVADGLNALCRAWPTGNDDRPAGRTLHLAGDGTASWAEFAEAIMGMSAAIGGPSANIEPIATAEYPTRAARPANSRLDSGAFSRLTGYSPPDWREALKPIVARLLHRQAAG